MPYYLFVFHFLHLQPILKGLSGDADHVANADRLERSGVYELISRSAVDAENGGDVIQGVYVLHRAVRFSLNGFYERHRKLFRFAVAFYNIGASFFLMSNLY